MTRGTVLALLLSLALLGLSLLEPQRVAILGADVVRQADDSIITPERGGSGTSLEMVGTSLGTTAYFAGGGGGGGATITSMFPSSTYVVIGNAPVPASVTAPLPANYLDGDSNHDQGESR